MLKQGLPREMAIHFLLGASALLVKLGTKRPQLQVWLADLARPQQAGDAPYKGELC